MANDEIRATAVHTPGNTGFSIEIAGKFIPLGVRRYSEAETHADHINRVLRLVELRTYLDWTPLDNLSEQERAELDALEKELGL